MIPSREKCFELLKEYRVPENIVAHILQVNRVAMFLAKKLKEKGEKINLELVDAASLLHDLDKHMTFNEDSGHGEKAAEILESLGFAEVAPIVRKHITTAVLRSPLKTLEEKLVYYADMRVKGNKIVTVNINSGSTTAATIISAVNTSSSLVTAGLAEANGSGAISAPNATTSGGLDATTASATIAPFSNNNDIDFAYPTTRCYDNRQEGNSGAEGHN